MNENMVPEYQNVTEAWEIHDTILIGPVAVNEEQKPGWFGSYATFGAQKVHSFFNVRNRGEVGLAYANLQTKDQIPYVFHIYSIGLNFVAPPGAPEESLETPQRNEITDILFAQTIQNHVGVRLIVREDEKLLNNGMLTPEGAGTFGSPLAFGPSTNTLSNTAVTPGNPQLGNRFPFPTPIAIPRGATFSVEIELSSYAQQLLTAVPGPTLYTFDNGQTTTTVPKKAIVRCSLIGKRAVQQRGALHY